MIRKDARAAKNSCLRLLKIRPRSEYELRSSLKRKGFEETNIAQALRDLKHVGLINDELFARLWVDSRAKKPYGLQRLSFELKTKGIDRTTIKEIGEEFARSHDESKTVEALIQQQMKKYKNLEPKKAKARLWRFLAARGFSPDTISEALSVES